MGNSFYASSPLVLVCCLLLSEIPRSNQPGEERVYLAYLSPGQSLLERSLVTRPGRNLEAGTEAETTEGPYLPVCFPGVAQLLVLYRTGHPAHI